MNKQTTAPVENKDFLTDAFTKSVQFCKQNRKQVLATLVVIIAIITGICLYVNHCKQLTENSWAAYYTAQMTLMREGQEAGFAKLDEVSAQYKGTPAAEYAQLLKGDVLYSQENFAQAANVYKELVNSSNETVRTVAALSQAAALQATKDYSGSITVAKDFIEKNSKSFALPQAYLTLALSQELAGQKDQAVTSYKYLLENYTKTYFGTFAKDKLTQLQK